MKTFHLYEYNIAVRCVTGHFLCCTQLVNASIIYTSSDTYTVKEYFKGVNSNE